MIYPEEPDTAKDMVKYQHTSENFSHFDNSDIEVEFSDQLFGTVIV